MPLYRTYRKGELVVGIWKVEETIEELCARLDHFSLYEDDFMKLKADKRKQEWLAVRVLLKELLKEEKKIIYHSSGKPSLEDGSAKVSFSHTVGYVAVAIHPTQEVGIDIEQYATRVQRLASRFVRPDEQTSVESGDEVYVLLLHWSAKETMFKLMNQADVDFIDHLRIAPFVLQDAGELTAYEYRTDKHQQFHIDYCIHPDYVLTYSCVE